MQSDRTKCKKILTNLKETAKSLREECEKKEELKNQLKVKYERLKGGNKRLNLSSQLFNHTDAHDFFFEKLHFICEYIFTSKF